MAEFIAFNEGRQLVEDSGWPASVKFDLSTKAVADFTAADTYATRGVITGTGYTQQSQAEPAATGLGVKQFAAVSWNNGAATDWQSPKTIVASDGAKIICAWNILTGGAARDMSQPGTTLTITPATAPVNP